MARQRRFESKGTPQRSIRGGIGRRPRVERKKGPMDDDWDDPFLHRPPGMVHGGKVESYQDQVMRKFGGGQIKAKKSGGKIKAKKK